MQMKRSPNDSYSLRKTPLSWADARYRLREALKDYLKDPISFSPQQTVDDEALGSDDGVLSRWIRRFDLDLFLTVFFSCSLLVTTILLHISSKENSPEFLEWIKNQSENQRFPPLPLRVSLAEVIGAGVILIESILGVFIIRWRRYLLLHDGELAKQREIRRYLKHDDEESLDIGEQLNHLTSLTGIYPVYRQKKGGSACWTKLPSLLLVHGDWVALQVGDVAPATVTLVADNDTDHELHIQAGEQITIDHFSHEDEEKDRLPKGRTTLPPDSDHLLELSNCLQIFRVRETPIESFLRQPSQPYRASRLARQVESLRTFMTAISVVLFVLSFVVVFARRAYNLLHAPFLVALGVLPVSGPLVCFSLEIIGTARILKAAHPYSIHCGDPEAQDRPPPTLWYYLCATTLSRLSLWKTHDRLFTRGIRVPPASIPMLESLGVATAFTLVDDELACEPQSIPQQLLIPSRKGLKLLDICPVGAVFDGSDDDESGGGSDSDTTAWRKHPGKSFDSDSDDSETSQPAVSLSFRRRPRPRRKRISSRNTLSFDGADETAISSRVQFEEPQWWQYLPSLKCIGLACLLNEEAKQTGVDDPPCLSSVTSDRASAKAALVRVVCHERYSRQLKLVAECIGFSTEPNSIGDRGDISTFQECLRLQLISGDLFRKRLTLDAHERGTEQAKWWGLLRPDCTSVVVKDSRTNAHQLLTVGDPSVVAELCNEAWQGEISTILPLAPVDRQAIIDTARDWRLGDLDVAAFSYTPVPYTLEKRLRDDPKSHVYLLDNSETDLPIMKDKYLPEEWTFIKNQVFLGVLGSLVVPRRETQRLLKVLNEAGVRFVYFSPRNMRRQKELAMQMGIDVAWNCAISLRPLEHGEEDPHRMVSQYADWTVKAKLPHGVAAVRTHLKEADNVPLLVSLFTDSTKQTTKEMVEVFQEYNDTVVSLGVSHLPTNAGIFASSDVSIGVDVLRFHENTTSCDMVGNERTLGPDLEFVSAISALPCAFRLGGFVPATNVASILSKSRASQEAVTASGVFFAWCSISYSIFVFLSLCSPLFVVPFVSSATAAVIFHIVCILALSLGMTDGDQGIMKRVPVKNDKTNTFGRNEGSTFYIMIAAKAIPPALLPQLLHFIIPGSMVSSENCDGVARWTKMIRCHWGTADNGPAWVACGNIVAASFGLNLIISSAGFIHRFLSIRDSYPWFRNYTWLCVAVLFLCLVLTIVVLNIKLYATSAVPWYGFVSAAISPLLCLSLVEYVKQTETKQAQRSEKFRRLQFETRLGQWSPR